MLKFLWKSLILLEIVKPKNYMTPTSHNTRIIDQHFIASSFYRTVLTYPAELLSKRPTFLVDPHIYIYIYIDSSSFVSHYLSSDEKKHFPHHDRFVYLFSVSSSLFLAIRGLFTIFSDCWRTSNASREIGSQEI